MRFGWFFQNPVTYGQQLTYYALLFKIMQCQQEKAVTLLHTVNVIGHHGVFVINVYIIQGGTEYNLKEKISAQLVVPYKGVVILSYRYYSDRNS